MKCTVEWVDEAKHKAKAQLPSTKYMWSQRHEQYIKRQLNNERAFLIVRPHKDTVVIGVFAHAKVKSYRRYIILKSWLADPYLGQTDKMTNAEPAPFLEALMHDLMDRPATLKEFPDPDKTIT